MTKRECAVIMAYTGVCMLACDDLDYFYEYSSELIGRPVYTHELPALSDDLKEKAKPDFIRLCKEAAAADTVELHKVSSRPKSEQYVCTSCGKFCFYPHCKAGIQYLFCPNCGKAVRGYV